MFSFWERVMPKYARVGVLVGVLFFLFTVGTAMAQATTMTSTDLANEPMVKFVFSENVDWCKTRKELRTNLYAPKQFERLKKRGRCGSFARVTSALVPLTVLQKAFEGEVVAAPAYLYPSDDPQAAPSKTPVFLWVAVDTK